MAPSQQYIELIHNLQERNSILATSVCASWSQLRRGWVEYHDNEDIKGYLVALAEACYARILVEYQNTITFPELQSRAIELHIAKNAGYSGIDNPDPWANFREVENFDIAVETGIITRMSDKFSRYIRLMENDKNEQVGESIVDTLMDLAAYSLILLCILEEQYHV